MDDAKGDTTEPPSYKARKDDPEFLLTLVDKFVKIELIKETVFSGFVYTIDPVTHSVILQIPNEGTFKTMIIPGHAVINITCVPAPEGMQGPPRQQAVSKNAEEILSRKNKITAWFKANLLNVSEDGQNIVIGTAHILPPYGTMDIYAENSLVAMQIRKMISDMPADFKSN